MNARESDPDTGMNTQSQMPAWQGVLFLIAALLILAAFFVGVAQWLPVSAEAVETTRRPATPHPAAHGDVPTAASFEYFPDQYVNQATRVEEHIEAF